MITGVTFVHCRNHPGIIAKSWEGKGENRHPYCTFCLRPIYDNRAVEYWRSDQRISDALDAYAIALKSGTQKTIADTRRTVRLYLSLSNLKTFERHIANLIIPED